MDMFLLVPTNQWKCHSGVWHTNVATSKGCVSRVSIDFQKINLGEKLGKPQFDEKVGSLRNTVAYVEHTLSKVSITT